MAKNNAPKAPARAKKPKKVLDENELGTMEELQEMMGGDHDKKSAEEPITMPTVAELDRRAEVERQNRQANAAKLREVEKVRFDNAVKAEVAKVAAEAAAKLAADEATKKAEAATEAVKPPVAAEPVKSPVVTEPVKDAVEAAVKPAPGMPIRPTRPAVVSSTATAKDIADSGAPAAKGQKDPILDDDLAESRVPETTEFTAVKDSSKGKKAQSLEEMVPEFSWDIALPAAIVAVGGLLLLLL